MKKVNILKVIIGCFKWFVIAIAIYVGYLIVSFLINACKDHDAYEAFYAVILLIGYIFVVKLLYTTEKDLRIDH